MSPSIERAQESLEKVLEMLESPEAIVHLTETQIAVFLQEHEQLFRELLQAQATENGRYVKLWESSASRTILDKCATLRFRVEQTCKSNILRTSMQINEVTPSPAPIVATGDGSKDMDVLSCPKDPLEASFNGEAVCAKNDFSSFVAQTGTSLAPQEQLTPRDATDKRSTVAQTRSASTSASPGNRSTTFGAQANNTTAQQTTYSTSPPLVQPAVSPPPVTRSPPQDSQAKRSTPAPNIMSGFKTPQEFNFLNLENLVKNGSCGPGDGCTINIGGKASSGAVINKCQMMPFYLNPPSA